MSKKASSLVNLAVAAVEDVKGLDLKVLDVRSATPITDHLVICTGTSNRHVRSIAENVIAMAKDAGHRPRGVEGLNTGEWVLVDLVDVVVHVMQAQTRAFYQLEKLWDVPAATEAAPAKKKTKKPRAKPKTKAAPKRKTRAKSRR